MESTSGSSTPRQQNPDGICDLKSSSPGTQSLNYDGDNSGAPGGTGMVVLTSNTNSSRQSIELLENTVVVGGNNGGGVVDTAALNGSSRPDSTVDEQFYHYDDEGGVHRKRGPFKIPINATLIGSSLFFAALFAVIVVLVYFTFMTFVDNVAHQLAHDDLAVVQQYIRSSIIRAENTTQTMMTTMMLFTSASLSSASSSLFPIQSETNETKATEMFHSLMDSAIVPSGISEMINNQHSGIGSAVSWYPSYDSVSEWHWWYDVQFYAEPRRQSYLAKTHRYGDGSGAIVDSTNNDTVLFAHKIQLNETMNNGSQISSSTYNATFGSDGWPAQQTTTSRGPPSLQSFHLNPTVEYNFTLLDNLEEIVGVRRMWQHPRRWKSADNSTYHFYSYFDTFALGSTPVMIRTWLATSDWFDALLPAVQSISSGTMIVILDSRGYVLATSDKEINEQHQRECLSRPEAAAHELRSQSCELITSHSSSLLRSVGDAIEAENHHSHDDSHDLNSDASVPSVFVKRATLADGEKWFVMQASVVRATNYMPPPGAKLSSDSHAHDHEHDGDLEKIGLVHHLIWARRVADIDGASDAVDKFAVLSAIVAVVLFLLLATPPVISYFVYIKRLKHVNQCLQKLAGFDFSFVSDEAEYFMDAYDNDGNLVKKHEFIVKEVSDLYESISSIASCLERTVPFIPMTMKGGSMEEEDESDLEELTAEDDDDYEDPNDAFSNAAGGPRHNKGGMVEIKNGSSSGGENMSHSVDAPNPLKAELPQRNRHHHHHHQSFAARKKVHVGGNDGNNSEGGALPAAEQKKLLVQTNSMFLKDDDTVEVSEMTSTELGSTASSDSGAFKQSTNIGAGRLFEIVAASSVARHFRAKSMRSITESTDQRQQQTMEDHMVADLTTPTTPLSSVSSNLPTPSGAFVKASGGGQFAAMIPSQANLRPGKSPLPQQHTPPNNGGNFNVSMSGMFAPPASSNLATSGHQQLNKSQGEVGAEGGVGPFMQPAALPSVINRSPTTQQPPSAFAQANSSTSTTSSSPKHNDSFSNEMKESDVVVMRIVLGDQFHYHNLPYPSRHSPIITKKFVTDAVDSIMGHKGWVLDCGPTAVVGIWFKCVQPEVKACSAAIEFHRKVYQTLANVPTTEDSEPNFAAPWGAWHPCVASVGITTGSCAVGLLGTSNKKNLSIEPHLLERAKIVSDVAATIKAPTLTTFEVSERANHAALFRLAEVIQMPAAATKCQRLRQRTGVRERLFQCLAHAKIQDDEWMYMLQNQEVKSSAAEYNDGLTAFMEGSYDKSLKSFGDYLKTHYENAASRSTTHSTLSTQSMSSLSSNTMMQVRGDTFVEHKIAVLTAILSSAGCQKVCDDTLLAHHKEMFVDSSTQRYCRQATAAGLVKMELDYPHMITETNTVQAAAPGSTTPSQQQLGGNK